MLYYKISLHKIDWVVKHFFLPIKLPPSCWYIEPTPHTFAYRAPCANLLVNILLLLRLLRYLIGYEKFYCQFVHLIG